ncbi:MAG TPA: transglutaminase-like domain-containing protein [Allosphingosinicella sp.]|nr:transglutaminase-like domain-containing protein [Allosphingosinicella sp.]
MVKRSAMALTALFLCGAAAPRDNVRYYAILADGDRIIGHAAHVERWSGDGPESVDTSEVQLQELDQPILRISSESIARRDRTGRIVWLSEYSQTGTGWSRTEARIENGRAEISHRTRTERWSTGMPLPADVRFDGGSGLLRTWNRETTPRLEFQDFNLGARTIDRVVIEAAPGAASDAQGRIAVLRKRYEGASLRAVARLLLDRDNRIVELTQPSFGTNITIRPTDRATALRARAPYSMLRNAQVDSPYRIQGNALQGHIRYRFGFKGGLAFDLPQTTEQRVAAAPGAPGTVTVDICATCGPGLAESEAGRAEALRPTRWLQSDHPRIRAIAATYARSGNSEAQRMEALAARVTRLMPRVEFGGHYSALETLVRRAGDCTEAAVLLATLGRAVGIPTRVASGLVYSRDAYHGIGNVFMPHSWVLAYVDGEWKSFDAALDRFDSTHIALIVGDGDARSIEAANQLAGLLEWQGMTEVRARPAA